MVSYDGNLTITGSADVFDTIANATQIEITGLSLLDGHRTVTVYPETNSIAFAIYHSKGATTYLIDPETGEYLIDPETGDFIIASEGGIPPGDYTVTIVAIIGTTSEPSCTITVSAGEFCCECQDAADAAALDSAQSQAEECIEEDLSLLYRNSDIEYTATCPAGQYGEYEATVAYNTYTSTVSQQDADQKALNAAIFEAVSSIVCSDVPPEEQCSWGGETLDVTNGSTFTGTTSSSAAGVGFSLDIDGNIAGTTTALYNTSELTRSLIFSKDPGAISGTIDFNVSVISTDSLLGFAAFGFTIYEDGIATQTVIRPGYTYPAGNYSIPYTIQSSTVDVEIKVGAAVYSQKVGGSFTGEVQLTGTITSTPCS